MPSPEASALAEAHRALRDALGTPGEAEAYRRLQAEVRRIKGRAP